MFRVKKQILSAATLAVLASSVVGVSYLQSHRVFAETTTSTVTSSGEQNKEKSNSNSSMSDIVAKESKIIANSSIYHIQIGYQFDDGSFDVWQRGVGFLVSNQELLTIQTLADNSTSSALYTAVLEKKEDGYKSAGIDLKDEEETEKHFKILVTNSSGQLLEVKSSTVKNGMGLISLAKRSDSTPAVFAEEEDVSNKIGTKYKLKLASLANEKVTITEVEGALVKPSLAIEGKALAMTADHTLGEVLGSPVYNLAGNIIGMVSNVGDSLTVIPTVGLQTFLTNNSVQFDTRITAEKKDISKEQNLNNDALEDIEKAVITTKKLEKSIAKAEKVKSENYTDESFEKLRVALKSANDIMKNEDKSQAEVDSARKKLDEAYKNLEEYSLMDRLMIPAIVGVFVLVAGGLAAFFVFKSKNKRGLPKPNSDLPVQMDDESDFSSELSSELQRMSARDLEDDYRREQARQNYNYTEPIVQRRNEQGVYENIDAGLDVTDQVAPRGLRTGRTDIPGLTFAPETQEQPVDLSHQRYGVPLGGSMNMDEGDEETTVLSNSAYLVRKDSNAEIPLRDGFIIGKERKKVHYCISGNPSISRAHAQFRIIDGRFYIEDLASKNYTYLNGNQLPAYKAAQLNDGDLIKMSDVEFVFYGQRG